MDRQTCRQVDRKYSLTVWRSGEVQKQQIVPKIDTVTLNAQPMGSMMAKAVSTAEFVIRTRNPWIRGLTLYRMSQSGLYKLTAVTIAGAKSTQKDLQTGLSQGSVLGPLQYSAYTAPLFNITKKYSIEMHMYADDTQFDILGNIWNFRKFSVTFWNWENIDNSENVDKFQYSLKIDILQIKIRN